MRGGFGLWLWGVSAGTLLTMPTAVPQQLHREVRAIPLVCAGGDCPLLEGTPQTAGMRSGLVQLQAGATVGWHTTGSNEEALVILQGQGEALVDGQAKQSFVAPAFVYIPPTTRHNVTNTGKELLKYVYVIAPAKLQ